MNEARLARSEVSVSSSLDERCYSLQEVRLQLT